MSDKFENLINAGKGVSLQSDEKIALDNKIKSHIQANPISPTSIPVSSSYALPIILAGLLTLGAVIILWSPEPEQVSDQKIIPINNDTVPVGQSDKKQVPTTTTATSSNTRPVNQWPGQGRDAPNN